MLAYLTKHERATVDYLATAFAVSKETIRSDPNELARLNLVQRCYGGAIIVRRSLLSELIAPAVKILRCCSIDWKSRPGIKPANRKETK
ncbi:MAG: DeoR family transcriptional regulator [Symbiopectobacterium sp.]